MTDFTIADHGSIVVVTPQSEAAQAWIEEFVLPGDEVQLWGPGIVVEPRYVDHLIEGIHEAGMEIKRS